MVECACIKADQFNYIRGIAAELDASDFEREEFDNFE